MGTGTLSQTSVVDRQKLKNQFAKFMRQRPALAITVDKSLQSRPVCLGTYFHRIQCDGKQWQDLWFNNKEILNFIIK